MTEQPLLFSTVKDRRIQYSFVQYDTVLYFLRIVLSFKSKVKFFLQQKSAVVLRQPFNIQIKSHHRCKTYIYVYCDTLATCLQCGSLRKSRCAGPADSNIIIRTFSRPNESVLIDSVKRPRGLRSLLDQPTSAWINQCSIMLTIGNLPHVFGFFTVLLLFLLNMYKLSLHSIIHVQLQLLLPAYSMRYYKLKTLKQFTNNIYTVYYKDQSIIPKDRALEKRMSIEERCMSEHGGVSTNV